MLVKNELNQLSERVEALSTKRLTKCLANKFGILNGSKYFYLGIFQNYLVFIPAKKALNVLVLLLGLICGNLTECQKKILKI